MGEDGHIKVKCLALIFVSLFVLLELCDYLAVYMLSITSAKSTETADFDFGFLVCMNNISLENNISKKLVCWFRDYLMYADIV